MVSDTASDRTGVLFSWLSLVRDGRYSVEIKGKTSSNVGKYEVKLEPSGPIYTGNLSTRRKDEHLFRGEEGNYVEIDIARNGGSGEFRVNLQDFAGVDKADIPNIDAGPITYTLQESGIYRIVIESRRTGPYKLTLTILDEGDIPLEDPGDISVDIENPADEANFAVGARVSFAGKAFRGENRIPLLDDALTWKLNGRTVRVGSSSYAWVNATSGTHQVTLVAEYEGQTGEKTITIHVGDLEEPVSGDMDVNGDGRVDQNDALVVLLIQARVLPASLFPNADVNGDKRVDGKDALAILQKVYPAAKALPSSADLSWQLVERQSGEDPRETFLALQGPARAGVLSLSFPKGVDLDAWQTSLGCCVEVVNDLANHRLWIAFAAGGETELRLQMKNALYASLADRAELFTLGNDGELRPAALAVRNLRLPTGYGLLQNQPNPFNSQTVIPLELAEAMRVELVVYSVAGQRIRTLVDAVMPTGRHQVLWDGMDESGESVGSGIYLYHLQTEVFQESKRMLLLR